MKLPISTNVSPIALGGFLALLVLVTFVWTYPIIDDWYFMNKEAPPLQKKFKVKTSSFPNPFGEGEAICIKELDPQSPLYQCGLRPGDMLMRGFGYNTEELVFYSAIASATKERPVTIEIGRAPKYYPPVKIVFPCKGEGFARKMA